MATTSTPQLHPDDFEPTAAELQEEGQAAAQNAPMPLQNATRDLGVQYTKPTEQDAAPDGYKIVAGVPHGDPNTIEVNDQGAFDQRANEIVPHELYHTWSNNLPPSVKARMPQSKGTGDYGDPSVESLNAMRAKGMTLLDVPSEKGAEMMRWASKNRDNPKVQAAMKPWLDDMRNTPRSVIEGTKPPPPPDPSADIVLSTVRDAAVQAGVPGAVPDAGTINTHPRAPMGPRDDTPGMEAFDPAKHFVKPGTGTKLSTDDAQHYLVKAKGNKAVAREMAKHDNHTF